MSFVSFSSGSVIADVLVKSTNSTKDRVMKVIEQEFEDAKFGSIPVDRYFFSIKPARGKATSSMSLGSWGKPAIGNV